MKSCRAIKNNNGAPFTEAKSCNNLEILFYPKMRFDTVILVLQIYNIM
jgi:hypothetical protein